MSNTELPDRLMDLTDQTRELVQTLLAKGLNYVQIAEALGDRVSSRTVYRWAKGENAPQRRADVIALEHLVKSLPKDENRLE